MPIVAAKEPIRPPPQVTTNQSAARRNLQYRSKWEEKLGRGLGPEEKETGKRKKRKKNRRKGKKIKGIKGKKKK